MVAKSDQQHDRECPPQVKSYCYFDSETFFCHPHEGTCKVQILRSSSKCSLGLLEAEVNLLNLRLSVIFEFFEYIFYIHLNIIYIAFDPKCLCPHN